MLILASGSASRKALLAGAGVAFTVEPAGLNERALEAEFGGISPDALARRLAEAKALAVARRRPSNLVIGADQTLALDGELLHKPEGREGARRRLDRLRGRTHRLHAGLALARGAEMLWSHVETAALTMRDFSARERDRVLDLEGDAVLGSVGAYRLEGPSVRLFDKIEGDYFAILGLPLLPLLAALRRLAPEALEAP